MNCHHHPVIRAKFSTALIFSFLGRLLKCVSIPLREWFTKQKENRRGGNGRGEGRKIHERVRVLSGVTFVSDGAFSFNRELKL